MAMQGSRNASGDYRDRADSLRYRYRADSVKYRCREDC
jgi:hypothetical protein